MKVLNSVGDLRFVASASSDSMNLDLAWLMRSRINYKTFTCVARELLSRLREERVWIS